MAEDERNDDYGALIRKVGENTFDEFMRFLTGAGGTIYFRGIL